MSIPVELYKTAFTREQLVTTGEAQIVFAGRSNVGKSSLLNALFGQKLARTSSTPGKTQSVNYYRVKDRPFFLVDLPGYGFARASKESQSVWSALIGDYFEVTRSILRVCVLIDSRLPPQQKDLDMLRYATEQQLEMTGILTKTDKCTRSQIHQQVRTWEALLGRQPYTTSVKDRKSIRLLEKDLCAFTDPEDPEKSPGPAATETD